MSKEPKPIFRLRQARTSTPAPTPSRPDLPADIHGQPASYFWKDVISVGDYSHPSTGQRLRVDLSRLRQWAATGKKLLAAGVRIPINCDHSELARDAVGQVLDFRVKGNRLFALAQLVGTDGPLLAARNLVSVGIDPDLADGLGRRWGEAIVHLALTPAPVAPNQGGFIAAGTDANDGVTRNRGLALATQDRHPSPPPEYQGRENRAHAAATLAVSAGSNILTFSQTRSTTMISLNCDDGQFQVLRDLLPDGAAMTADDCIGRVIAQLQALADPEDDDDADEGDDAADGADANDGDGADANDGDGAEANDGDGAEANDADGAFNASANASEASMRALVSGIKAHAQACVERGAITPAVRDRLLKALSPQRGKPGLLAFSTSAGDEALATRIFSILQENRPTGRGAMTGLQALHRVAPDDAGSRGEPLYKKMAALADGRRVEL